MPAALPAILGGLALGYAFGSIPFGLLLTRWAGLGDVRAIGSGNIGATNVLRTGRKGLALATLLLDALKGTVAILICARWLGPEAALAAGAGAFIGHVAPIWLGFKGGKGVATFIGCLLGLDPRAVLVFAVVWLGVAFATRYSSAAALAASIATPLGLAALGNGAAASLTGVLAAILWAKHAPNIARLRAGTEGRIGGRG
ncbi:MAG: glycerol-3-phosphate 1-O-acyltransferase PlsY [Methylobacteriaceae bacterium]|nr:glycerol-3-phosphate 1-O-acyltransferase PlsY [Methylobacteriaceae bacterium]